MSHPKDDQLHPIGSKVAIDGREGTYALYHDDIEVIEQPTAPEEQ